MPANAETGYSTILASMLLCKPGSILANGANGHSHANAIRANTRLMICNVGKGFTAPSRFFVMKSQRIFGQKKPSIAAAT